MTTPRYRLRIAGGVAAVLVLIVAVLAAINIRTANASSDPWSDLPKYRWFVAQYEARHGTVSMTKGFELVDNAIQMCDFLDKNPSLPAAFQAGTESGMSSDQAVSVIELGVQVYCPNHLELWKG